MKLIHTVFLTSLLIGTTAANAAIELMPEDASKYIPFKKITVNGQFNKIGDAVRVISKRADNEKAHAFYINNINYHSNNDSIWVVTASLYKSDAQEAQSPSSFAREYNGIYEYTEESAKRFQPFERITLRGNYSSLSDGSRAVAKVAARKGAYAYYVVRQSLDNQSQTQVIAHLFMKDAPRIELEEDLIPYDSEAGQRSRLQGEKASKKVESSGQNVAKVKRYTVNLPDGSRIEELNKATAEKMQPFERIKFTGVYYTPSAISQAIAKKAAEKNAKFYHVIRISYDGGSNSRVTVQADLFK